MSELVLTGIDGSNPLGFLAALGVLNALSDGSSAASEPPRLCWRNDGAWRPVLIGLTDGTREGLIEAVASDLATWEQDPAIHLRYTKVRGGKERESGAEAWDLKPPPEKFRAWTRQLLADASAARRRAVDFAAAFATDVAVDNNGNTKPTALHFTAGQQEFLAMVHALASEVTREDLDEALFGPWQYARPLPVLQWDSTAAREYALRATDPSKDKKAGVPGADWLAFRGLSFMRVAPNGSRIATTGCRGEWKTGKFRWPLWAVPIERATVQSVVQLADLESMSEPERRARGIAVVFQSNIRRSDQGGYGSFAPAAVV